MRESWQDYFMRIAHAAATRATCDRARVGAVVVRGHSIVATGYNGAPSGYPHCDEIGHHIVLGHCLNAIHAEMNAINQARDLGVDLRQCEMYVTHCPCETCASDLVRYRVRKVWFGAEKVSETALEILKLGGVEYEQR